MLLPPRGSSWRGRTRFSLPGKRPWLMAIDATAADFLDYCGPKLLNPGLVENNRSACVMQRISSLKV